MTKSVHTFRLTCLSFSEREYIIIFSPLPQGNSDVEDVRTEYDVHPSTLTYNIIQTGQGVHVINEVISR